MKKNAIIPKDIFYRALVDSLTLKKESANKFLFDRNEDLVPDGFKYMKVSWSNPLSKEDSLLDYQNKTAGNIYNKIMNRKTAWGLD